MKLNKTLLLFLFSQLTVCQITDEKNIHGKISIASGSVEGVNIVNLVNEKSTVSDKNGEFSILAKADDLLVFSSVNLEYHRSRRFKIRHHFHKNDRKNHRTQGSNRQ